MSYEMAWLNEDLTIQHEDNRYFKKINCINLEADVVALTALEELKWIGEKLLHLEVDIKTSSVLEKEQGDAITLFLDKNLVGEQTYHIESGINHCVLRGSTGRSLLDAVFHLLRLLRTGETLKNLSMTVTPDNPMRMMNHWDNMDGSIERGYSGDSFFFKNNEVIVDERTKMYARLMASIGINGTVINNVNVKDAATYLITDRYRNELQEMSAIFGAYGIRLFLSLNYAAPMELGELDSADPLEPKVIAWWEEKLKEVYLHLPSLGGFLVKADSEGRPGPFTYGRNHAEGANMLGRAIAPYGGTIIWRCFVYNCQQDWRDKVTDRARAGFDHFAPLDGQFLDNVILQIKNGPMDFQVREPVSPLLGGLKATNQILEVQIAQEYTGQQRHVCYLIPMFKEILGFKTYCHETRDTVADIVSGRTFSQKRCGMATVVNTGNDENWTGHDLAAANLYGFGRLSYDTSLSAEAIALEWIQMTYGTDMDKNAILLELLMGSWPAYEQYTVPLGIGWMVQPNHHYGPSVDGYEYSRWGTYHRADHLGLGVDRSDQGTCYALQYNEPNSRHYNHVATCPEELLLFFHHVPYTHVLSTGKTVIQHIYDTHFDGVTWVESQLEAFKQLIDYLPTHVFNRTLERLEHQLDHAKEWRDQVNTYFYRKSGISDSHQRVIY